MVTVFSHRNLPYCISEANIGQICTRWVSGQQCSGHKSPPDHGRPERQQTALLPKPVTLTLSSPGWLSVGLFISSPLVYFSCRAAVGMMPSWVQKSVTPRHSCTWHSFFFCLLLCSFFVHFSFLLILHSQKNLSTRIYGLWWSAEGRSVKLLWSRSLVN